MENELHALLDEYAHAPTTIELFPSFILTQTEISDVSIELCVFFSCSKRALTRTYQCLSYYCFFDDSLTLSPPCLMMLLALPFHSQPRLLAFLHSCAYLSNSQFAFFHLPIFPREELGSPPIRLTPLFGIAR